MSSKNVKSDDLKGNRCLDNCVSDIGQASCSSQTNFATVANMPTNSVGPGTDCVKAIPIKNTKRIIRQIKLDTKKLQQFGLDVKIAEALTKQKRCLSTSSGKADVLDVSCVSGSVSTILARKTSPIEPTSTPAAEPIKIPIVSSESRDVYSSLKANKRPECSEKHVIATVGDDVSICNSTEQKHLLQKDDLTRLASVKKILHQKLVEKATAATLQKPSTPLYPTEKPYAQNEMLEVKKIADEEKLPTEKRHRAVPLSSNTDTCAMDIDVGEAYQKLLTNPQVHITKPQQANKEVLKQKSKKSAILRTSPAKMTMLTSDNLLLRSSATSSLNCQSIRSSINETKKFAANGMIQLSLTNDEHTERNLKVGLALGRGSSIPIDDIPKASIKMTSPAKNRKHPDVTVLEVKKLSQSEMIDVINLGLSNNNKHKKTCLVPQQLNNTWDGLSFSQSVDQPEFPLSESTVALPKQTKKITRIIRSADNLKKNPAEIAVLAKKIQLQVQKEKFDQSTARTVITESLTGPGKSLTVAKNETLNIRNITVVPKGKDFIIKSVTDIEKNQKPSIVKPQSGHANASDQSSAATISNVANRNNEKLTSQSTIPYLQIGNIITIPPDVEIVKPKIVAPKGAIEMNKMNNYSFEKKKTRKDSVSRRVIKLVNKPMLESFVSNQPDGSELQNLPVDNNEKNAETSKSLEKCSAISLSQPQYNETVIEASPKEIFSAKNILQVQCEKDGCLEDKEMTVNTKNLSDTKRSLHLKQDGVQLVARTKTFKSSRVLLNSNAASKENLISRNIFTSEVLIDGIINIESPVMKSVNLLEEKPVSTSSILTQPTSTVETNQKEVIEENAISARILPSKNSDPVKSLIPDVVKPSIACAISDILPSSSTATGILHSTETFNKESNSTQQSDVDKRQEHSPKLSTNPYNCSTFTPCSSSVITVSKKNFPDIDIGFGRSLNMESGPNTSASKINSSHCEENIYKAGSVSEESTNSENIVSETVQQNFGLNCDNNDKSSEITAEQHSNNLPNILLQKPVVASNRQNVPPKKRWDPLRLPRIVTEDMDITDDTVPDDKGNDLNVTTVRGKRRKHLINNMLEGVSAKRVKLFFEGKSEADDVVGTDFAKVSRLSAESRGKKSRRLVIENEGSNNSDLLNRRAEADKFPFGGKDAENIIVTRSSPDVQSSKNQECKEKFGNIHDAGEIQQPSSSGPTNQDPVTESEPTIDIKTVGVPLKIDNLKEHLSSQPVTTAKAYKEGTTPQKGRRGRKPAVNYDDIDNLFNPRLLLIRNRSQIDSNEELTCLTTSKCNLASGMVRCGFCLGESKRTRWVQHLREHYGVGWIEGDTEVDVTKRSVVLNRMIQFFKENNVTAGLVCRLCSRSYRSALGMLQHIEQCGAPPMRVLCEFCQRNFSKLSLPIHLKTCEERSRLRRPLVGAKLSSQANSVIVCERQKRASRLRAEMKLKAFQETNLVSDDEFKMHICFVPPFQFDVISLRKWARILNKLGNVSCPHVGCSFAVQTNMDDFKEHTLVCEHAPQTGYVCQTCKVDNSVPFKTKTEALQHVELNHIDGNKKDVLNLQLDSSDSEISGSEKSDTEESDIQSNAIYDTLCHTDLQVGINRSREKRRGEMGDVALKWQEFTKDNYANSVLYASSSPIVCNAIPVSEAECCLPEQKISMKFGYVTPKPNCYNLSEESFEWQQLPRFESLNTLEGEHVMFLGGPCKAVAWVPLPPEISSVQYLLVAYRRDITKYTRFKDPVVKATLLLLYEVKKLSTLNPAIESTLLYAVQVKDGPVHCLEFLPSGSYDAAANRLGIVAVGSTTSRISVFALPIQSATGFLLPTDSKANNENGPTLRIIDLLPAFVLSTESPTLMPNAHELMKTHCRILCWSQQAGHRNIFAGFANGCIGIWDIKQEDNVNLSNDGTVLCFLPLHYFYSDERFIIAMAVHYDGNGPRWLVVTYKSRKLEVYDIRNLTQPRIIYTEYCTNVVPCIDWPVMMEPFFMGYDDTITNAGRSFGTYHPLGLGSFWRRLDIMLCSILQLHFSPLQNMLAVATENGEVLCINTNNLVLDSIASRPIFTTMRSFVEVKSLKKSQLLPIYGTQKLPVDWKMFDDDYKQKFGVVFSPLLKHSKLDKKKYMADERIPLWSMLRYVSVNCMRWNMNRAASTLLAVGHNNGFLRILDVQY